MAHKRMGHLMEQRTRRDARTKESDTVVRHCNAMAEKESWTGWNQVKEQVGKINQSEWKKHKEES